MFPVLIVIVTVWGMLVDPRRVRATGYTELSDELAIVRWFLRALLERCEMKRNLVLCQAVMLISAVGFLIASLNWKSVSGSLLKPGEASAEYVLEVLKVTERSLGYCLVSVGLLIGVVLLSWVHSWKQMSD